MTGKELRGIIDKSNKSLADVARHLSIIPQTLNSKLKSKDLSYKFVTSVLSFIEADVSFRALEKQVHVIDNIDSKEIESLKNTLKDKNDLIELLREKISLLEKGTSRQDKQDEKIRNLEIQVNELKKLFDKEEDFRKALKFINKPIGETSMCMTDLDGRTNFINGQFTKQTGYNEKDMIGRKPGHVLQRGNSDQPAIAEIRKALRNREYFEGEVVNYDKQGNEIICKLIIAPARGKSAKIDRFISLAVFSKINVLKYN